MSPEGNARQCFSREIERDSDNVLQPGVDRVFRASCKCRLPVRITSAEFQLID